MERTGKTSQRREQLRGRYFKVDKRNAGQIKWVGHVQTSQRLVDLSSAYRCKTVVDGNRSRRTSSAIDIPHFL